MTFLWRPRTFNVTMALKSIYELVMTLSCTRAYHQCLEAIVKVPLDQKWMELFIWARRACPARHVHCTHACWVRDCLPLSLPCMRRSHRHLSSDSRVAPVRQCLSSLTMSMNLERLKRWACNSELICKQNREWTIIIRSMIVSGGPSCWMNALRRLATEGYFHYYTE